MDLQIDLQVVFVIAFFVWGVCCVVNSALLVKHALPEKWKNRKTRRVLYFLIFSGPIGLIAVVTILYLANIICHDDWDSFE